MAQTIPVNQPEEQLVKVQPKGLLTIPKSFRTQLGIKVMIMVRIVKDKQKLLLEPGQRYCPMQSVVIQIRRWMNSSS